MSKPLRIVVDSQLRIPLEQLSTSLLEQLQRRFEHDNPAHHKLKRINRRAAYKEPEHLVTHTVEDGELLLPRGGAPAVRDVLRAQGIEWRFVDKRAGGRKVSFPPHRPGGAEHPGWILWDHQREVVEAVLERENCLVRAPTGSGKTTAAIAAIAAAGRAALVVVWNTALLEQWRRRIRSELGLEAGVIKGKRFELRDISVAMQQTLWRFDDRKWEAIGAHFGMLVCDEVQRFAAKTFADVVRRIPARYRIGLSADESRKDGKEPLIYDEFGEVVCEIEQQRLVDLGVVLEVEVRIVPTDFEAGWYVEQRKRAAEAARQGKPFGKPPDYKRLLDEMVADEDRCSIVNDLAMEQVAAGHQTLVLSERVEHCRRFVAMATACGVGGKVMVGEEGVEREAAIVGLTSGELRFAAGTIRAIGQGLDLPSVSRGVVATPLHTNKQQWGQVRGRLCRVAEGKVSAVIYYLWDRHVFGTKPVLHLKRWNNRVLVLQDGLWIEAKEVLR